MAANILQITYMDENGRVVNLSAREKEKEKSKFQKFLDGLAWGSVGGFIIGVIIGFGGGGTGGYYIKKISIEHVPLNRMS